MLWQSSLESAIEVAIGIAGFSGIVAAMGRRADGHWKEADQTRLSILLTATAQALVFSFLPFVLIDLIGTTLTWRLASGVQAIFFVAITSHRMRTAFASGISRALGMHPIGLVVQTGVGILLIANAIVFSLPSIYVSAYSGVYTSPSWPLSDCSLVAGRIPAKPSAPPDSDVLRPAAIRTS